MRGNIPVRRMVFIALMAAILCTAAPFAVFLPGGFPLSLTTLVIYVSGIVLGKKDGTAAVVVYILLGAAGLPVFSGFSGGLGKLLGVTGGYIVGYIPCALITGLFADLFPQKKWAAPLGAVLGTITLYAVGTAWFVLTSGSGLLPAAALCVVPFLPGDAVKIAAASAAGCLLRKKLENAARS